MDSCTSKISLQTRLFTTATCHAKEHELGLIIARKEAITNIDGYLSPVLLQHLGRLHSALKWIWGWCRAMVILVPEYMS